MVDFKLLSLQVSMSISNNNDYLNNFRLIDIFLAIFFLHILIAKRWIFVLGDLHDYVNVKLSFFYSFLLIQFKKKFRNKYIFLFHLMVDRIK